MLDVRLFKNHLPLSAVTKKYESKIIFFRRLIKRKRLDTVHSSGCRLKFNLEKMALHYINRKKCIKEDELDDEPGSKSVLSLNGTAFTLVHLALKKNSFSLLWCGQTMVGKTLC